MSGLKRNGIVIWLILFVVSFGMSVFAQDYAKAETSSELEDLFSLMGEVKVTTPTAASIPLRLSPGSVSVITAEQIENFGFSSIIETMRLVPGAEVQYSQMMPKVGIRSVSESPFSEEVHLLIDGVSYNSPDKGGFPQHPGYDISFFPLEMIKQVEIVRGPSSAQWGNGSFWGVLNMVTKDIEGLKFNLIEGEQHRQKYSMMYGDSGEDYGLSMILNYERKAGGTVKLRDDTPQRGVDFYLKGRYGDFTLNWFSNFSKIGTFPSVSATPGRPVVQTVEGENEVYIAQIAHNKEFGENLNLKTSFGYNSRRGSNCGSCHNPNNTGFSGDGPRQGTGEKYFQYIGKASVNYSPLQNHNIDTGVEIKEVTHGMHMNTTLHPDNEKNITEYSLYLQDEIKWLKKENLITTIGTRYDWEEVDQTNHLSPKFALVYNPIEELVLRTSFSKGIRLPVSHDRTLRMPMLPSAASVVKGNPNLKAQRITMGEVGAEYFFTKNLSTKIDFFVSEVKNAIMLSESSLGPLDIFAGMPSVFLIGGGREQTYTFINNPNKFWISGGELEIHNASFNNKVKTILGYAYEQVGGKTSPSFSDSFSPSPSYSPNHKFFSGVIYSPIEPLKANLFMSYRGGVFPGKRWGEASVRNRSVSPYIRKEGYLLFDAKLDWIQHYRTSDVKWSIIGKNLLNEEAKTWWMSDAFSPDLIGRQVYLQTSIDF